MSSEQLGSGDQEKSTELTYSGFCDQSSSLFGSTPFKLKNSPFNIKFDQNDSIEIPFQPDFQRKGTSIAKYRNTNGYESSGNDGINDMVQYHSITAMTEYGQKSFEELRFEDFNDKKIINDSCKLIGDILINHFNQSNDSGFNDSNDVKMERKSKIFFLMI